MPVAILEDLLEQGCSSCSEIQFLFCFVKQHCLHSVDVVKSEGECFGLLATFRLLVVGVHFLFWNVTHVHFHHLLLIVEQNCDEMLGEVVQELIEPLTHNIVFFFHLVTTPMRALVIVYIVHN
jgi:hypothetical protein